MLDDWRSWIENSDKQILRDRIDMAVWRIRGANPLMPHSDVVVKKAKSELGLSQLQNARRFFYALLHTSFAPLLVANAVLDPPTQDFPYLLYHYVVDDASVDASSAIATCRSAINMRRTLRELNIMHGDLTSPNLVISDSIPVGLDWDEARFLWDQQTFKRPEPDDLHLYPAIIARGCDPSRILRRWLGIYDHINPYFGWGRFLDLGTHKGDFCGIAEAAGMQAVGVDDESISPCLEDARSFWPNCTFIKQGIPMYFFTSPRKFEVIAMFSTWPYLYETDPRSAFEVLDRCISDSGVFLFETQLYGDGPGPEFLKTKQDVVDLLYQHGAKDIVEAVTVPVEGRDAERTIFAVWG